jgi:hypothetical protein
MALRTLWADLILQFDKKRELEKGNKKLSKTKGIISRLESAVGGLTGVLGGLGAALAGVAGIGAMASFAQSTLESTNELMRWSNRLQISVAELRSWTVIAAQFGADVDDVTDGFKELQLKAKDALTGGTAQREMFERIGISLDDLRPRVNDAAGLMDFFVQRLENVNDESLRNFTVDELMSDAGTRLLPVFNLGSEALRRMRDEMSEESAETERLARLQTELNRVIGVSRFRLQSLATKILIGIVPALEWIIEKGGQVVDFLTEAAENSHILEVTIGVLAAALVAAGVATSASWGPVVLTVMAVAIAIAALILIIDDLWVTIEGGESVTRRLIDGLLGVGTTGDKIKEVTEFVTNFLAALDEFGTELSVTWTLVTTKLQPVVDVVRRITEQINNILSALGVETTLGQLAGEAGQVAFDLSPARFVSEVAEAGERARGRRRRGEVADFMKEREAGTGARLLRAGVSQEVLGASFEAREQGTGARLLRAGVSQEVLREAVPSVRGRVVEQNVDARMDVDVSIQEATDAQAIQRIIENSIRVAQQAQAREIEATLVREPSS